MPGVATSCPRGAARGLPDCQIVILTTFGRPGYLRRALASGARGFIVKDSPAEQACPQHPGDLAGECVVDPALPAAALAGAEPADPARADVLAAAGNDGASLAHIAAACACPQARCATTSSRASGKTRARNRAEAVRVAQTTAGCKGGRRP